MTDEEPSEALSPEEDARIRALLAEAKHDEPMPDAVVARLDRVLAGLAEEPVELRRPANVVALAERRRRAARMLVAAAAVVVVGLGVGQVVRHGTGGTGGQADSATAGGAPAEADQNSALEKDGPDSEGFATGSDSGGGASVPSPSQEDSPGDVSTFRVRPKHFAQDSRRAQSVSLEADALRLYAVTAGCVQGHWGAGKYVPVEYGRTPAYLVLRRHTGDSQVVDLFLCGSDAPVRSVTLPGP